MSLTEITNGRLEEEVKGFINNFDAGLTGAFAEALMGDPSMISDIYQEITTAAPPPNLDHNPAQVVLSALVGNVHTNIVFRNIQKRGAAAAEGCKASLEFLKLWRDKINEEIEKSS